MMDDLWVIIAAGGSSRRYGERDKLLEILGDMPVFLHSIRNFSTLCKAEHIVVVVQRESLEKYRECAAYYLPELKINFVPGGSDRSGSVRNGLDFIPSKSGIVAVHDAARPLATAELLERVARRAAETGGAIAAIKVVDSLKLTGRDGRIISPVSRDDLYRAETPQVFDLDLLRQAYDKCKSVSATDDAEIMRLAGFPVEVVETGSFNLKLTTAGDLDLLKLFYNAAGK
ncbi:MAG: 2-C-methyl-D-erythritol 4-phosphate cytidylyltransferase [Lentisphaeria bacterium]|nr:2-C-methyl-D-erythritol 4-phosphate cytidylyltransferase [Lentisphaeria bacterium]